MNVDRLSPDKFHVEFVVAIELHEKAYGPHVIGRVTRRVFPADDVGSRISHHRIISAVQKFHAKLLQDDPHCQTGHAFLISQHVLRDPILRLFHLRLKQEIE